MPRPQSDIPPMPIEIMIAPILAGLLIGFVGLIAIELGGDVWGAVLICFSVAIAVFGCVYRRHDWQYGPEHRSDMLRHSRW